MGLLVSSCEEDGDGSGSEDEGEGEDEDDGGSQGGRWITLRTMELECRSAQQCEVSSGR